MAVKAALSVHTRDETSDLALQGWGGSSVIENLPGMAGQALGSIPSTTKEEGSKRVRTKYVHHGANWHSASN